MKKGYKHFLYLFFLLNRTNFMEVHMGRSFYDSNREFIDKSE